MIGRIGLIGWLVGCRLVGHDVAQEAEEAEVGVVVFEFALLRRGLHSSACEQSHVSASAHYNPSLVSHQDRLGRDIHAVLLAMPLPLHLPQITAGDHSSIAKDEMVGIEASHKRGLVGL